MSSRKSVAKHNTYRFYYDECDRLNGKSPATGKPYPTHTRCCLTCHEKFQVVHYPRMKWHNIMWCSRDCCWLYRYGRKYQLTKKEERERTAKTKKYQRLVSWKRTRTPDECALMDHLTAQFL